MFISWCDAPRPWGIFFQDSASPQMEALVELHNVLMFYLVIIIVAVSWILLTVLRRFRSSTWPLSSKYLTHGTVIEVIWTIVPALVLILIAFPSFKLLYLTDEVPDASMTVKVEGHQWYWSVEYPDYVGEGDSSLEFDSYIVPESDLPEGAPRQLEVDNPIVIPELTHVRLIISSADVIHSFACPALGLKCDAYPGRLNQVSTFAERAGLFYGQCSEICGVLHSSMPILIKAVSLEEFLVWLDAQ